MKKLLIGIAYLTCSLAWADGDSEDKGSIEALKIRLATIEQIDVTAEKTPIEPDDAIDAEIDAILDKAEALETSED